MSLKHDYFIIESLTPKDINDGQIFYDALKSIDGYSPTLRKVKTKQEFEKALIEFSKSDFKYLFISSHGDEENIELIKNSFNAYDLEDISIDLNKRRIFMSTCKGGSFILAKYFIKKGAYSVIGTPEDLFQIVATGMWVTMAWIFERLNNGSLNFKEIDKALKLLSKVYQIKLNYYSFLREKQEIKEYSYSHTTTRQRKDYPL